MMIQVTPGYFIDAKRVVRVEQTDVGARLTVDGLTPACLVTPNHDAADLATAVNLACEIEAASFGRVS